MKQLTMTKVLTPLAALAFAFGVQAAVSTETFESYTAGTTVITNQTGWSFTYGADGADDASAIAAYDNNAPSSCPDGTTAGNNYLKLSTEDGTLFRNMDGTAAGNNVELYAGLFVDTDVQFTVTDSSDRPEVTDGDKFIIWLEADSTANTTNLCVWARQFTDTAATAATAISNVYTLAANVTPGEWYRLTVKALPSVGSGVTFPAFQIYLNGNLLTANEYIINDSTKIDDFDAALGNKAIVSGKSYFPAMVDSMSILSKVGFSGEGALDNVVVTREVPAFEEPTTLTFTWDSSVISSIDITSLGASLASSGSTLAVYPGQTFDVTVNWQEGYSTSTHALTTSSSDDTVATVSDLAVETLVFGSATIALTTTAKDTVDMTVDWGELLSAMTAQSKLSELTSVTLAVSTGASTTYTLAQMQSEYITSATLSGLKAGTNVTVTVTYSTTDWATTITPMSANVSLNDNVITVNSRGDGTATVNISAALAAASVDGQNYATFAEALAAANGSTIQLRKDLTVSETVAIANGTSAVIDLAGNDITGASGAATVFTVADGGALTITNSTVAVGAVTKGDATAFIVNNGTLNLDAGNFGGAFSGEGTTYVNGGAYDATAYTSLSGANLPTGKALADNGGSGTYVYELADATYNVTVTGGANATAAWTVNDSPAVEAPTSLTYGDTYSVTFTANSGYKFTGTPTTTFSGTASAAVSIAAPDAVACVYYTAISFDKGTLDLTVGNTGTITATLTPGSADDDSVTWASSDTSVATVENGTVTAVAAGKATITLTATHDTTVKATCTVTVTAAGPEIPDITPSADGESAQSYTEADATTITNAINNAKSEYIKAPTGVTGKNAEDYSAMFEAKVVPNGEGGYKVVVELTEASKAEVQSEANDNVAEVIGDLSEPDVQLTTKPGLYYSFEYGTTLGDMTEGDRTLATDTTTTLTRPTTENATSGFYKVLVNTAPKPAAD